MNTDPRIPSPRQSYVSELQAERRRLEGDGDGSLDGPFVDDYAEATDRMLEMISAVDFLRRGDRRDLTLWAAIEEALRWWTAERVALLDGYVEPALAAPQLGGFETLPSTLLRFIAVAGQDEPVHLHLALQQALRRWSATLASRHNGSHSWPPPVRWVSASLQLTPETSDA